MLDTSQSAATTIASWRAAGESGDADAAVACLSPDIVLSSPLTEQFRLEGPDQLRDFLAPAFTAVEDIHFHTETGQGDTHALVYRARVGTRPFEEAQLLRLDDKARIREIALFRAPDAGAHALMITLPRIPHRRPSSHQTTHGTKRANLCDRLGPSAAGTVTGRACYLKRFSKQRDKGIAVAYGS